MSRFQAMRSTTQRDQRAQMLPQPRLDQEDQGEQDEEGAEQAAHHGQFITTVIPAEPTGPRERAAMTGSARAGTHGATEHDDRWVPGLATLWLARDDR